MRDGKRTEDQRIDDAEHRAVRADAEREREDRRHGESRAAAERAERVADVLSRAVPPGPGRQVVHLLFDEGHVADGAQRRGPGGFG